MEGKKRAKVGKFFRSFWYLLWQDNSLKGWIFSLVFIFIFIKFVFFPVVGLVSGSSLPLAIVESCSMYHKGDLFSNFNSWWQGHESYYEKWNISKSEFESFRFDNGFDKGDIMFVVGTKPQNVRIGDIIVFNPPGRTTPIIHRVMNVSVEDGVYYFSTLGDNNMGGQFSFENGINQDELVGKAVFKVFPFVGWAKQFFFEVAKEFDGNPETSFEGLCVGL